MLCKPLLLCVLLYGVTSNPHHHTSHETSGHELFDSEESSREDSRDSKESRQIDCKHGTLGSNAVTRSNEVLKDTKNIPALQPPGAQSPRVQTSAGAIRGSWMESRKGRRFQAFRGIRYAEAPVGPLRFEVPRPIQQYQEEVDASEEGPACPTRADEYYYPNFSEDCLRLNVYTPTGQSNASLPVIVYIHAGGFYSMSGRSDLAGPHYLMDRDLVLVTINYRLGSLGFLSTGDALAPGNNGFKDQVVALRWVRRHIRAFGGDPDLVTLAGTSAGSFSVVLHMISPMSRGLFHRGIAMSGSPVQKAPVPPHQRHLAVKQARLLGCPTDSTVAILDCLRTKTWREIGDSLSGFFEFAFDPVGIWQPIVEPDFGQERFLPTDPAEAIKLKRMHAVPLLISQTEDEFYWLAFTILSNATLLQRMQSEWERTAPISFMLPEDRTTNETLSRLRNAYFRHNELVNDSYTEKRLGMLYGDAIIGYPVFRLVMLMSMYNPEKVFYYNFEYVGEHSHYEDPITKKPIGAMHHDELIYLFSLSYRFPAITPDSPDAAFVDLMTAMWYTFAKHGDPNPRAELPELTLPSWPKFIPQERKYMRLDRVSTVGRRLKENRFEVWEDLYRQEYCVGRKVNDCV